MSILILDAETTGLDPKTDKVIEVAVVQYNVDSAYVISSAANLIRIDGPNTAERINHIPEGALKYGVTPETAWSVVKTRSAICDAVVAHNAAFDRSFLPPEVLSDKPWICTCHGVQWPLWSPDRKLLSLAAAHGVPIFGSHRALGDCLLLASLLTRCKELGHDVEAMLRRVSRPMGKFRALVSKGRKDEAKAHGFRWDPKEQIWWKEMAIEDATEEKLGFAVIRLDGAGKEGVQ